MKQINTEEASMQKARQIMQLSIALKKVQPSKLLAGSRKPRVSYVRSLVIYSIITNVSIHRKKICELLNLAPHNSVLCYGYNKIKRQMNEKESVRADVVHISEKLKQSA